MTVILQLLVILVLTILEGFFVSAEISIISIRRSRLDQLSEDGNRRARRVRRLKDDPGRFLAVVQLGLTVLGFFASAYAAVNLSGELANSMRPVLNGGADGIALLIVTVLLALFTIVFGELVPKSIGLAYAERLSMLVAGPVEWIARVLGPIVWFLTRVTSGITRILGVSMSSDAQMTAEELKLIVERGGEQGILEAEEEQMINAVIELGDRRLHEVMVPRIAIVALPVSATLDEAIDLIVEEGHSRVPVYEESIDGVIGIVYAKDLLPVLKVEADARPTVRSLLRTPLFVPESMSIDDLLHEFQRRKVHIAIVLDEYGGTAGLLTIEDLLEEIVGEIQDEYDVEEPMIVRLSADEARIDGRVDVDELGETFDITIPLEDEDEYDTVGGLIFHRLGHVPRPGDEVRLDGLKLTVETTDGRRVGKVLAVRQRDPDDDSSGDEDDR
ncbi:MAG TPA: hemolysin family protein [Candidatus Limnocylindrales bacterium]|nr:hemolysin family protein [Candidatus Limnocylindrales bacterium]